MPFEIMWENIAERAGQATGDSRLNTSDYKHTLTIRNTYCFSTATTAALRRRLNITL